VNNAWFKCSVVWIFLNFYKILIYHNGLIFIESWGDLPKRELISSLNQRKIGLFIFEHGYILGLLYYSLALSLNALTVINNLDLGIMDRSHSLQDLCISLLRGIRLFLLRTVPCDIPLRWPFPYLVLKYGKIWRLHPRLNWISVWLNYMDLILGGSQLLFRWLSNNIERLLVTVPTQISLLLLLSLLEHLFQIRELHLLGGRYRRRISLKQVLMRLMLLRFQLLNTTYLAQSVRTVPTHPRCLCNFGSWSLSGYQFPLWLSWWVTHNLDWWRIVGRSCHDLGLEN
jgi:hypothetical protein